MNEPEVKQGLMEDAGQLFNDADSNGDGVLNFEEFCVFLGKSKTLMGKRLALDMDESPADEPTKEQFEFVYHAHRFSQNETGVTLDDLKLSWVHMEAFYRHDN